MSIPLDQLVERICKLVLRDWTEGIATGGNTLTLVDTARTEQDDYWNSQNAEVYIRGGVAAGSTRPINDFVLSTNTLSWLLATGSIAAGTPYSLHVQFKRDDVIEAVNSVIDAVARETLVDKIDEASITLVAGRFEYPIPAGFSHLYRLTMADAEGEFTNPPIQWDQYKIIRGDKPLIHLYSQSDFINVRDHTFGSLWANSDFTADHKLRLEGYGPQERLIHDNDLCHINPMYVIAQAGAWLHASRIRRAENEPDDHRVQAQVWQAIANGLRMNLGGVTQLPPDTRRVVS